MSTVAEIESAIERLPGKDLRELLSWMDDYRAALGATEALFSMYDEEDQNRARFTSAVSDPES